MEQGPDELSDRADDRAEQLRDKTEKPLDEQGEREEQHGPDDDTQELTEIDPGL